MSTPPLNCGREFQAHAPREPALPPHAAASPAVAPGNSSERHDVSVAAGVDVAVLADSVGNLTPTGACLELDTARAGTFPCYVSREA